MHLICLEAAVILGIVIPQLSSISISSAPSDCLASVDICMSDLCKTERAFYSDICGDDGCRIKGSDVCNMTIQFVLDQFPSLQGCVCAWQEELCDSIQALATQCRRKPVYDGSGSCLEQITVCISDAVCNRHLAPVLQACTADQCNSDHCQQVTQQFYGSMPQNVADMLAMCECEASDQSCLDMKTTLQGGMCGKEAWICQETVNQCVKDNKCRDLLKTFEDKCWRSEEAMCSYSELQNVECLTLMDPALILGADSECKKAFFATLGTALHYPCTCKGVHSNDLPMCNKIHDVFHNRSHFKMSWKHINDPSKPPDINKSEQAWATDYVLYTFATVFVLVGVLVLVIIVMPLTIKMCKTWMFRRRDKKTFQPAEKSAVLI